MKSTFICLTFASALLASGCGMADEQSINTSKRSTANIYVAGSERKAEAFKKRLDEVAVVGDAINEAARYFHQKEYDAAIDKFSKILNEMNPRPADKPVIHSYLGDAYEALGDYASAIKEIDWILAHKPRKENPDYIDGLIARKQNLEKLLSEKK